MPPTPDGTLCEPGTLRRQSIDTLKSASNSLAPGNTEGSVSRTEFSVKLHLEVTRMTLALSRTMETRTVFFRAFLHNTKEIVPGQLEHQQWGGAHFTDVVNWLSKFKKTPGS